MVRVDDGPADRTSMPKHYINKSRKKVQYNYLFIALCTLV